jgi:4-hydroxy-2-oxoheptanedioate aldolase
MARAPNKLRAKLASGVCATGAGIFSWSPYVIDVAGVGGLDYVRIDTEHAWRRDDLEHLIRAATLADIVALVRVDRDKPELVRKALEIGAGGIIVADVRSVKQAEAVVQAAKFPPHGTRGYSGNCWSAGWGAQGGVEWIEWSNREPLIGIMIEHVEAMTQLDEIMAVDGIDFALFGPADYAMSLGLGAPNAQDERVQGAIVRLIAAAHQASKHVSLVVGTDPANIKKYVEQGIDMLELGNDLSTVRAIWTQATLAVAEIAAAGNS